MTLEEIQTKLGDGVELTGKEQKALWKAVNKLDEPMRASMISAFVRRYPDH